MKEGVKTLVLSLLLASSLILVALVWMKIPSETKQIINPLDREREISEELRENFMPRKAIINFGGQDHTQTYQVKNLWPFYENILLESFPKEGEFKGSLKEISHKEYINLHQKPSVVFDLGNKIYSHLFLESFKMKDKLKDLGTIVDEIYFSSNGAFFVLVTDQGNYRLDLTDISSQGMEKYIKNLKEDHSYEPYKSLFELYNVESLIYIPTEEREMEAQKSYRNDLNQMGQAYVNDMIQRFLGEPVEGVRVIEEEESTLYVVDQKALRLDSKGLIDFTERPESKEEEPNLSLSIKVLRDFILQKTGMGKNSYFESISEIEKDGRKGYHIKLNYLENMYPVFPLKRDKQKAYMEVDIIENKVVHFSYLYRTDSQEEVVTPQASVRLLKLDQIIFENLGQVGLEVGLPGKSLAQILEKVENINDCLIDDVSKENEPLEYGYEIDFGHKTLYFRATDGQMIMER